HACVSCLPILRGRGRNDYWNACGCPNDIDSSSGRTADRWNLWLSVRPWISKFSDNLDDRALTALSCHTGRREKIDSLFLVERANHDLKLGIGENPGQSKDSWSNSRDLPETWQQKRIERARTDREITAAVS